MGGGWGDGGMGGREGGRGRGDKDGSEGAVGGWKGKVKGRREAGL